MQEEKVVTETSCYHCGDPCEADHLQFDEKDFCCHGCKTVYEILNENDLCDYYDLEQTPGYSLANKSAGLFDFLASEEIKKQLLDFADNGQERVSFFIPNIHCSSCIWLLEHLDRLNPGVIHTKVNFSQRKVSFAYNSEKITLQGLAELLDQIGYAPMINLEEDESTNEKTYDKKLLTKLGIAGFCFGNVMLLSFPEYLGLESMEDQYQQVFRLISAVMSLPVLFYSANDYFISAYKSLKQKYINIDVPIALGVITLAVRSFYEVISQTGAGYFDSLVALIFFLLIGRWFQNLTYRNLSFERDYKSYFPLAVQRVINGLAEPVLVKEIKKGDQLLIRNSEVIPADAILIDEQAGIDYSFVSGESEPVQKSKGELIYAGGRLVGKQANFIAQKDVSQSYLTSLWNQHDFDNETEKRSLIDQVSQYFTVVIIAVATIAAAYWQLNDPSKTWLVFTAVLIVACPCALALATPFTHGSVLRVFSRNSFYLKSPKVIESLQKISHIVFDKTGTLTNSKDQDIEFIGETLTDNEAELVSLAMSSSTHPLSRQIARFVQPASSITYQLESYEEIHGKGIKAHVNGLPIKVGSAAFVGEELKAKDLKTRVYVQIGGQVRGCFIVQNTYRQGVDSLVSKLSNFFKLSLLSGDNESEKERLKEFFPLQTKMYFNQSPHDKLAEIKNLQASGEDVMMLGDGLNDAGALQQSEVGLAISEDISNFSPASDAILEAKELPKLSSFFTLTDKAKTIVIWSFVISFVYNIGGLSFAVAGWLTPLVAAILMPLSSITVVLFTTLAVNLHAKKLKI